MIYAAIACWLVIMRKKLRDDFCVFILTNGRPENQYTLRSVLRRGYTGRYYFVVDDEDPTLGRYLELYGDKVVQFSKSEIAETTDEGDNLPGRCAILYARNASFELAKNLGMRYFLQLDDDYTTFGYRFDAEFQYGWYGIHDLDALFAEMLEFYISVPNCLSLCMSQGGDHAGGGAGSYGKKITLSRKAMNTFLCSVDRPIKWYGKQNEDVSMYVNGGRQGLLFFTANQVQIAQRATQKGVGGMSKLYAELGTYMKAFYSVMYCPSSVTVGQVGEKHKRLHHRIDWRRTVPKILHERWAE